MDARSFGNEARFIRRSCTPNAEVREPLSLIAACGCRNSLCVQLLSGAARHRGRHAAFIHLLVEAHH